MKTHRSLRSALLALSLTALAAAPALAQYRTDRYYRTDRNDTQVSFSLNFNRQPHWNRVYGTRVMVIRERPGYDVFRYGPYYYAYRYGRWYRADDWRGDFYVIDAGAVPYEFRRVPRRHWRAYPNWRDYDRDRRYDDNRGYDRRDDRDPNWDRNRDWNRDNH